MRNNENRTGSNAASDSTAAVETAAETKSPLEFVTPTDFVELPSKGMGYATTHPLHNKEVIEIKYMTAKEEDILTSRSLLRKNMAIERLLQSVIVNKTIDPKTMLTGDRNAVLIQARASAYGSDYTTLVACPSCGEKSEHSFDLENPAVWNGDDSSTTVEGLEKTEKGTFIVTCPATKFKVELKLMTGEDEQWITHVSQANKKNKMPENLMSLQYQRMIVSVEGHSDRRVLDHFLKNAPAKDMRYLKNIYRELSPDVKITKHFECPSCDHEQELEVPFGADFFWPDA